ncbi:MULTISPECIES: penicillin-binding transpeptidase domain-containing protein [Mycobacteroides]|uniref:Penicillin-binding protein n=1 Tax=Mycobacteroides chelonae TaxID=1774 RepID=A0A1S1LKG4_MYCCH|nr:MULTISPECIES: penicillin-binding transpeptidase domain-containing protein [Mycobacteroides]KRQ22974.1 penicillin-binding protein [Mycobacteroides sp. H003]KRQ33786.1 penicillin-binding protein [Mycobacteroides sp. H092]KRQ39709.1 penicillin-binding protein [Mycobacteroides sp. H101]KRQ46397.1 penicillin-binding protein [Mycobacteroides sp. H063]KRQ63432.1 penicillin-binding protein [Mycobacteroides sp. HXVII]
MFRRVWFLPLFGTALLVAGAVACTPRPDGPGPVAEKFFEALANGDTASAAKMTDDPDGAKVGLDQAFSGLQATSFKAAVNGSQYTQDTGSADATYVWQLPRKRTWTYSGRLEMLRTAGSWQVRWAPSDLHPKLGERQSLSLRTDPAKRATVNESGGTTVLAPANLYKISFDASQAGKSLMSTATALADAIRPYDDQINAASLAEQASAQTSPMNLITLRKDDWDKVSIALETRPGALRPGVVMTQIADLLPTDDRFAPDIVAQVKKAVLDELDGEAGWRVVSVNQNGVDTAVLNEVKPNPAPSKTISLDRAVQNAAQNAVNTRGQKAMMVVIKPSTGDILAVAQNAAANADGPLATTGLFPPGSTFKIITAGAALERGMATPDTMVGCPKRVTIGDRSIPNYNEFDLGTVPMWRAFANSCNTTFAKLASEMPLDGLTVAASQFGIGPDYDVAGIPTISGNVPPTVNLTERTEDGFGQGKVLVTPFGMALAAATVANGKTPVPQLISGQTTGITGERPPVTSTMIDGLRGMMRETVLSGTAMDLKGEGSVYGKTGEAEFPGGSHAWFAGYRGDMAFATLIVGGGGSEAAVRATRVMFQSLPPDYLA